MKRRFWFFAVFISVVAGTAFLVLFANAGTEKRDQSAVTPTPSPTVTGFFPLTSYVSPEARTVCAPLSEGLATSDALGIIEHMVTFRSRTTGEEFYRFRDYRLGVAFRINQYVLTARHVAGPYAFLSEEEIRKQDLVQEDFYEFHPLDHFFSATEPIISSRKLFERLYDTTQGISLSRLYVGDDIDVIVFKNADLGVTPDATNAHANPLTLTDFEPFCIFRVYVDPVYASIQIHIVLSKSFTEARNERELRNTPTDEDQRVGAFTFYGGRGYGRGASGSPIFLEDGNGNYAIVGIAFALTNFTIGLGHDVSVIRDHILSATGIDIFQK